MANSPTRPSTKPRVNSETSSPTASGVDATSMTAAASANGEPVWYHVGAFATLTGVSVRTLHHYDRLGLLKPSARGSNGYRRYSDCDVLRLQQILTLRYLGFGLRQIGRLLDRPDFSLELSARFQSAVLAHRLAALRRVQTDLNALLDHFEATGTWDWRRANQAVATVWSQLQPGAMEMDPNQKFTAEQLAAWQEHGKQFTPEAIRAVERDWADLLAEINANLDCDPASPMAQAFVEQYDALLERTFKGNSALMEMTGQAYQSGQFADVPGAPTAATFAFMTKARSAGRASA